MDAVLKIEYIGSDASCLIEADASAETITSKTGAIGSETTDSAFGSSGVIDTTNYDTIEALVDEIDGYTDYAAEIQTGDDTTPADGLLSATVYAKPEPAYIIWSTTSPLEPYALVTWPEVKQYLDLYDDQEDYASLMINGASRLANRYAQRHLAARDYTETYDGTGIEQLMLREFPINSVSSVRIDGDRIFGGDTEVTDYIVYEDEGELWRTAGVWPRYRKGIQVQYNAGLDPVPEDLKIAVLEVVAYNWKRFQSKAIGTRSQTAEGVTTDYEITVPTNAQRVFESYGA